MVRPTSWFLPPITDSGDFTDRGPAALETVDPLPGYPAHNPRLGRFSGSRGGTSVQGSALLPPPPVLQAKGILACVAEYITELVEVLD